MQGRLSSALLRTGSAALSSIGREALRIVLPSWCVVCDGELDWSERKASCCARCWSALPAITRAQCSSCAMPAPVSGADPFTCLDCVHDPLPVDWCVAWGEYRGGLERLLRAFKFGRHDFLAEPLAGLLARAADARGDLSFDALTAVPMRPASERRRGYNQSDLLARALASHLGIPCEPLLVRRGTQAKQSTLPRRARAANVRHAFSASPLAAGKRVLIVDDICTTGETLRACAAALRAAGASGVAAITVAKAL